MDARATLAGLLDERRLRVGPRTERGFGLEGTIWLALETKTARRLDGLRAVFSSGSGGRQRLRGTGTKKDHTRACGAGRVSYVHGGISRGRRAG
jgi:hypothetical protein